MEKQTDICATCVHDEPGYCSVIGTIPHCCSRHWHCEPGGGEPPRTMFPNRKKATLMAGEKNFENRLKKWLESEGIYPLGEPVDRMSAPPCGFYEKRWGGSRYVKSGLPDMRITVKGIALEVELKATNGTPSVLQKRNIRQINNSGGIAMVLYPQGFDTFKDIIKGVKSCPQDFPIAGLKCLIVAHSNIGCDMLMD